MTDWTALSYVVVDVEGNGQQPADLVEIAAVRIEHGSISEPVSWLVRPGRPITPFAKRIHGITNEQVAGAPAFAEIAAEVLKALDAPALIAHNAHVDVGVLERELGDWECPEVFDTLKLSRRFLPGHPTYKLGSLVRQLGLDAGLEDMQQPHRAAYDTTVTARLFAHVAAGRSLEALRERPERGDEDDAVLF
ncbi:MULTISPECIES: 3'-5' exonuclease [Amycolatopsis]|uniref:3'-5' exonuclease n=1 Tax=Amycolatopsis echigonensis TaxID=2576905 RepID=A0A2N3WLJ8_9PSEU|nr:MULTISPECIES: 3'-5' exonuclease [Amycolatopsis]MBB2500755.1 3'-5' exonuclease [Amycolatopsis echigonensis]MCG3751287.1 3'-5' exonuclease [Amycolatopsis sp. Poz14]PKV94754.1 DNA polymerase-3 subunit epsilon/exodeoxyribonuclease X [Amycolatopsis niigatensis]